MSDVDQRSGGTRLRRFLARTLAVAGTTAAGASAAWVLGAGVAAAAGQGSPGDVPVEAEDASATAVRPVSVEGNCETASDAVRLRLGTADRALGDLVSPDGAEDRADAGGAEVSDHVVAVDSAPVPPQDGRSEDTPQCADADARPAHPAPGDAGPVGRVTDSVKGVLHRAEPVLRPVRRAGDALTGDGLLPEPGGRGPLPGIIGDDLPGRTTPVLERPGDAAGDGSASRPGTSAPRGPDAPSTRDRSAAREAPVPPGPSTADPGTSDSAPIAAPSVRDDLSFHEPASDRHGPRSVPALPVGPVPASTPCAPDGHLTTSSGVPGGAGLTGQNGRQTPFAASCALGSHAGVPALSGGPRPQPGVTPD